MRLNRMCYGIQIHMEVLKGGGGGNQILDLKTITEWDIFLIARLINRNKDHFDDFFTTKFSKKS